MEDLKMRHPELSEEVSISFPPLPESKTYDGSPEGIMELLRNIESVHFKATEFGIKLKLQKYQPQNRVCKFVKTQRRIGTHMIGRFP
jgi:hypothetical protein